MSNLIDRQAAIDAINRLDIPEDMCVFEILSHIELEIGTLPSAQPQRIRGKWIDVNDGKWNTIEVLKCSVCGEIDSRMYKTDNFCPNCGADMRGDQDE